MHYDFIIIGSGGAGLSFSLFLIEKNPSAKILISSKTYAMGSHTTSAKGGINASLGNISKDDPKWHIFDTKNSGKGLCDSTPTEKMCEEAPYVIKFLENLGVEFNKRNQKIDQRTYGGQTTNFGNLPLAHRACFVKDQTGHAIMQKLLAKVQENKNIEIANYTTCISLQQGNPHKIMLYNHQSGKIDTHFAKCIIFATGGFSQIYKTTSSSNLCTGCGHRILFESGFKFKDIELVQFHPTGLEENGMLISEACRSEGGFLINEKGERFMNKFPLKELSPRDTIAKQIHQELKNGKVFLDLRHINPKIITEKIISSYSVAKHFAGIDISKNLLPISPTAHYNMGGIEVDEHYHAGNGIYAIGELACASVHGANRLGCNSLLELFTSAKIASNHALNHFNKNTLTQNKISNFMENNSSITEDVALKIQAQIKEIMQKNASISKTETELQTALTQINAIYNETHPQNNFTPKPFNTDFITLFETQSLVLMAKCVLHGAIARTHSIGSHLREDYPLPPQNPHHTILNHNFEINFIAPK